MRSASRLRGAYIWPQTAYFSTGPGLGLRRPFVLLDSLAALEIPFRCKLAPRRHRSAFWGLSYFAANGTRIASLCKCPLRSMLFSMRLGIFMGACVLSCGQPYGVAKQIDNLGGAASEPAGGAPEAAGGAQGGAAPHLSTGGAQDGGGGAQQGSGGGCRPYECFDGGGPETVEGDGAQSYCVELPAFSQSGGEFVGDDCALTLDGEPVAGLADVAGGGQLEIANCDFWFWVQCVD